MRLKLQIIVVLLAIGQYKSAKAQNSDSVKTYISIEKTNFTGLSVYDILSLSPTSQTYKTKWQGFGIRVHQELNAIFQINSGITFQSTRTNKLPSFPRNFKTERTFYKNRIGFISIPLGAKMSINAYKRRLYTGLSFALDLNFHQGNTKEYAADFSSFGARTFKEQSIFMHKTFYASQEVGVFINYLVKDRIRMLMSVNAVFENEDPILLSQRVNVGSTPKIIIFDGNGIKFRFQLGYSILKSKPLFANEN